MGRLLLRADADPQAGTGHLMRMLALGHAWTECAGTAELVGRVGATGLDSRIEAVSVLHHPLHAVHPDAADAEAVEAISERGTPPVALAIDGYGFDSDYERTLRGLGAPLLVVDDAGRAGRRHEATLLLNQNLHASPAFYTSGDASALLLGPRYALLREEFRTPPAPRHIPSIATKLLVMFGGGDPLDGTSKTLRALSNAAVRPEHVRVLVAASNPHREAIYTSAQELRRAGVEVGVEVNSGEVRASMEWADLGVLASGTTALEAMATGLPSLLIPVAENQEPVAHAAAGLGAAAMAEPSSLQDEGALGDALQVLMTDSDARTRFSEIGRSLVDGRGAERVARVIQAWGTGPAGFTLRRVQPSDEGPLLDLANDPTVRSRSFSSEPITAAEHHDWFRRKLAAPGTRTWIAETDGGLAGQIRYDLNADGRAEIGISVAATARGRGVGGWLLRVTPELARSELGADEVVGLVLEGNEASVRAFLRAGFAEGPSPMTGGPSHRCFYQQDLEAHRREPGPE